MSSKVFCYSYGEVWNSSQILNARLALWFIKDLPFGCSKTPSALKPDTPDLTYASMHVPDDPNFCDTDWRRSTVRMTQSHSFPHGCTHLSCTWGKSRLLFHIWVRHWIKSCSMLHAWLPQTRPFWALLSKRVWSDLEWRMCRKKMASGGGWLSTPPPPPLLLSPPLPPSPPPPPLYSFLLPSAPALALSSLHTCPEFFPRTPPKQWLLFLPDLQDIWKMLQQASFWQGLQPRAPVQTGGGWKRCGVWKVDRERS